MVCLTTLSVAETIQRHDRMERQSCACAQEFHTRSHVGVTDDRRSEDAEVESGL
jgi:hypothetical protein